MAGDKIMPEMHFRQPRFTYSAGGPFTKYKERIQKFQTGDSSYIYKNKLDKACFQRDMAYGDFKDLKRRTAADKVLGDIINDLEKYASYFRGENYFDGSDGAQNVLVFLVGEKYFKYNFGSNSSKIKIWKSKGLSSQSLDLSGTVGIANDIKIRPAIRPIRPAYVIFNHKESFFEQKKKKIS